MEQHRKKKESKWKSFHFKKETLEGNDMQMPGQGKRKKKEEKFISIYKLSSSGSSALDLYLQTRTSKHLV